MIEHPDRKPITGHAMPSKLDGRVALVTGAGRGIGRATALKLAREGASLVASDLDSEPLDETVGLIEQLGGQALALPGDVAAPDFGERAIGAMLDHFGGIDILVNNAGYIWNTTIQKTTDEQWYAMLDVHATAPFRLLRAAQPVLKRLAEEDRARGEVRHRKVVNVSSVSGVYGAATQIAYASAKAAVIGLTRTLAREWGRYRVNVNCVAFGFIDTRLTQEIPGEGASIQVHEREHRVGLPREVRDRLAQVIPLGRGGTPEDAAGAIYLFCLPEADFVTGEVLECSGGGGAL